jgi:hypothetical protein
MGDHLEPTAAAKKQLSRVEAAIRELDAEVRRLIQLRAELNGGMTRSGRRLPKLTPQRRAQLKLQGEYMGHMRQLKPAQKKQVKAVREKRGIEAGIRMARKLAGS